MKITSGKGRIVLAVVLAGLAIVAVIAAVSTRSPSPTGPVIVILIDTLRADRLPIYGWQRGRTPAIDGLAKDGVVFERAYSHAPLTLPAHASLFSGSLPFEHGVRDNAGFTLAPARPLMAERLRDQGYATAGIVSSDVLRADTGIARGFQYYESRMPPVAGDVSSDAVQRDGAESVALAAAWLEKQQSGKFFLFLHLYEPHAPYAPPARFAALEPYDGEIAYSDELVDRLVQKLKQRGLYDAATIVLLSDHGEGLGDHGEREHGLFLYDDTIRVPLVLKQPHGAGRGLRIADPVQHVDLLPTLLDLIGAPPDPALRGRSLRPLLDGHRRGWLPAGIYAEAFYGRYHFGWSELMSLTDDRYRYIRAPREELYDLLADGGERQNVAPAQSHTRAAMRRALEQFVSGRSTVVPAAVSADQRERLMALGYLTGRADVSTAFPGDTLPDPKDRVQILEQLSAAMRQSAAGDEAAISALRRVVQDEPSMSEAWWQLASALSRGGYASEALHAYRQVIRLQPTNVSGIVAATSTMLRLRRVADARQHAMLAVETARLAEPRDRAAANEVLSRVAFAQADLPAARAAAAAAQEADPLLPLPAFIEGRVHYDAGRYPEAFDAFRRAADTAKQRTRPVAELHLYLGDTLAHLERFAEAERAFTEEMRWFPRSVWAHASLANLLWATGRPLETGAVLTRLLQQAPSAESYEAAAGLLDGFGEQTQAAAVRAEGRRRFGSGPRPSP